MNFTSYVSYSQFVPYFQVQPMLFDFLRRDHLASQALSPPRPVTPVTGAGNVAPEMLLLIVVMGVEAAIKKDHVHFVVAYLSI